MLKEATEVVLPAVRELIAETRARIRDANPAVRRVFLAPAALD